MDTNGASRRALLRGAIAGGTGGAIMLAAAPARATVWTPEVVTAAGLLVGDMIAGPGGAVVRVHSISEGDGEIRIRYTNPWTDGADDLPLDASSSGAGYLPDKPFLVFARGVEASPVRVAPASTDIVDGGRP